MAIDFIRLGLPKEVGVKDASTILNVDRKTVLGYIAEGVLPARNIALPSSQRPTWRLKLSDVIDLRTGYDRHKLNGSYNEQKKELRAAKQYEPTILKRKEKV